MRAILALLALVLLASTASASAGGDQPYYDVTLTTPSDECPDCAGVSVEAGTTPPPQCADCAYVATGVTASNDEDGTSVGAFACRGGFFYFCLVDEEVTL